MNVFTSATLNGCRLTSIPEVIFLANIPFTMFFIFQSYSIYIILLLSFNRFMAVYKPMTMRKLKKNNIYPLLILFIIAILLHAVDFVYYDIICEKSCPTNNIFFEEVNSDTEVRECKYLYIQYNNYRYYYTLGYVWWVIRSLLGMGIPTIAILLFNGLIIINLYKKQRYINTVWISLYIALTFLLCFLPMTLHVLFFSKDEILCMSSPIGEYLRILANIPLLFNNILHAVIIIYHNLLK